MRAYEPWRAEGGKRNEGAADESAEKDWRGEGIADESREVRDECAASSDIELSEGASSSASASPPPFQMPSPPLPLGAVHAGSIQASRGG